MDFMTSNSTMEGTLATAFRNSLVVAIADLMDDGKGQEPEQTQTQTQTTTSSRQQQQQPAKIESISKTSSSQPSHCSPYDTLYWLGGDCMRATAATSLSTIAECATMKTDNTTADMTAVVSPAAEKVLVASIVTPAQNSESNAITSSNSNSNSNSNTEQEELQPSTKNDSINSSGINTNANTDIISQYHRKYSDPKALFDDYGDYMDYADPINSLLVDDHHNDYTKNYEDNKNNSSGGQLNDRTNKLVRRSQNRKSNKSSIFCVNPELEGKEENWFSGSPVSTTAWCGGYPSLLTYDKDEEKLPQLQQYPDYYAEFKPQRQYAFDEEDGEAHSTLTPSRALMDGISSAAETGTANDTDSLVTSQSSVQSFMVINRPHTFHNSISGNLTNAPMAQKLQKQGSKRVTPEQRDHHLHKLIASPSIPGSVDSDSEINSSNNALDCALTQSLMRKLQKHLPYGKKGDSFWLQYSLIRDGASLDSLLDMVHSDKKNTSSHICSVLAIETVEGEVFGAFLTQTWRRSYNQWYGGGQSFLWTTALEDKNTKNKLRIFPYSFENSYVQLCDRDRLLVGGGDGGDNYERHCYGFGLALEKDLLRGSSCPCTTFESPSLSKFHSDGTTFEIRNLEVWTLTPCLSVIENPSEGLVRVHKREADKKHQQEKEKLRAAQKKVPPLLTIPSEESKDEQDDDSFEGFYSCAHPDCHIETDDLEDVRDLAAHTFPADHETTKSRKNRYVFLSPSM